MTSSAGAKNFATFSLRSNQKFGARLYEEIDRSDVLYLFWSRHAKRSNWVEREWRYGMDKSCLKVRFWSGADMNRKARLTGSVENDPKATCRTLSAEGGSRLPQRDI